eukprot:GHVN01068960.1.p1 GENE.GHVN01068960.1~~GHVN01068960.1.p1  ORF type:complete len:1055 (+),score=206.88 GHVN01068960.1:66-3230(+)
MGNHIGIDAGGGIIRVTCLIGPETSEFLSSDSSLNRRRDSTPARSPRGSNSSDGDPRDLPNLPGRRHHSVPARRRRTIFHNHEPLQPKGPSEGSHIDKITHDPSDRRPTSPVESDKQQLIDKKQLITYLAQAPVSLRHVIHLRLDSKNSSSASKSSPSRDGARPGRHQSTASLDKSVSTPAMAILRAPCGGTGLLQNHHCVEKLGRSAQSDAPPSPHSKSDRSPKQSSPSRTASPKTRRHDNSVNSPTSASHHRHVCFPSLDASDGRQNCNEQSIYTGELNAENSCNSEGPHPFPPIPSEVSSPRYSRHSGDDSLYTNEVHVDDDDEDDASGRRAADELNCDGQRGGHIYCLICFADTVDQALDLAIPLLGGKSLEVTGCGSFKLEQEIQNKLNLLTRRSSTYSDDSAAEANLMVKVNASHSSLFTIHPRFNHSMKLASPAMSAAMSSLPNSPLLIPTTPTRHKYGSQVQGGGAGRGGKRGSLSGERKWCDDPTSSSSLEVGSISHLFNLPVPPPSPPSDSASHQVRIRLQHHGEMNCILEALDFFHKHSPQSYFHYPSTTFPLNTVMPNLPESQDQYSPISPSELGVPYPYLLVNLKSGVSYHKVTARDQSTRVGGSTIGGATFLGLVRLLCGHSVYDPIDAFYCTLSGQNSKVDMLVGDIYGGDYDAVGLKGNVIASSFGKVQSVDLDKGVTRDLRDALRRTNRSDDHLPQSQSPQSPHSLRSVEPHVNNTRGCYITDECSGDQRVSSVASDGRRRGPAIRPVVTSHKINSSSHKAASNDDNNEIHQADVGRSTNVPISPTDPASPSHANQDPGEWGRRGSWPSIASPSSPSSPRGIIRSHTVTPCSLDPSPLCAINSLHSSHNTTTNTIPSDCSTRTSEVKHHAPPRSPHTHRPTPHHSIPFKLGDSERPHITVIPPFPPPSECCDPQSTRRQPKPSSSMRERSLRRRCGVTGSGTGLGRRTSEAHTSSGRNSPSRCPNECTTRSHPGSRQVIGDECCEGEMSDDDDRDEPPEGENELINEKDICRSLLTVWAFNTTQIAFFLSKIHKCAR